MSAPPWAHAAAPQMPLPAALAFALAAALLGALSCSSKPDLLVEEDVEQVFERGVSFRYYEGETIEARVGDFASFASAGALVVSGVGIVVGLEGSGDRENAFDLVRNFVSSHPDLRAPPGTDFADGAVALVMVEARFDPLDSRAAGLAGAVLRPIGNATSIENGTLLMTELTDSRTGEVFAVAAGPVLTTILDSEGNRVPTPTLGRLMTIEVKNTGRRGAERRLVLKAGWKELADGIADASAREFPKIKVSKTGALEIRLKLPEDPTELPEDWEKKLLDSRFTAGDGGLPRILLDSSSRAIVAVGKRLWINRGTFLLGGTLKVVCFAPSKVPMPPKSADSTDPSDGVVVELVRGGKPRRITTVRWLRHVVRVMDRLGTDFEDMKRWLVATADAGALGAEVIDASGMLGSVLFPEEVPKGGSGNSR